MTPALNRQIIAGFALLGVSFALLTAAVVL